jgi:DNA-binding winged helix-turn-helix (wHTH) protein
MRKFGETSEKDDQVTPAADWSVSFDGFRFKPRTGELWQASCMVRLPPRTADVLALLAERSQELVTKEELFARVWQGRVVGDESLTTCIRELRRALEDDARKPRYIETCHRRGYRLIVPATRSAAGGQVTPALLSFDKPSIAVLPFENLSGDPEQEYFCDGITEDITTALSRFSSTS